MDKANIEGLEEALEQVRVDAHKAGRDEGYAAGRSDAASILGHENAVGRTEAAADLAGDASISVERATSLLSKMHAAPAKSGASYSAMMKDQVPDVGPGPTPEKTAEDARAARIAELQGVAKNAAPRR